MYTKITECPEKEINPMYNLTEPPNFRETKLYKKKFILDVIPLLDFELVQEINTLLFDEPYEQINDELATEIEIMLYNETFSQNLNIFLI